MDLEVVAQGSKLAAKQRKPQCIPFQTSEVTLLPGYKRPHLRLGRVSRSHGGGAYGIRDTVASATENAVFLAES